MVSRGHEYQWYLCEREEGAEEQEYPTVEWGLHSAEHRGATWSSSSRVSWND